MNVCPTYQSRDCEGEPPDCTCCSPGNQHYDKTPISENTICLPHEKNFDIYSTEQKRKQTNLQTAPAGH
jgi:hypothetical protein